MRPWGDKTSSDGVRPALKIRPLCRQLLPTPPTVNDHRRRPVLRLTQECSDSLDQVVTSIGVDSDRVTCDQAPFSQNTRPLTPRSPTEMIPTYASFVQSTSPGQMDSVLGAGSSATLEEHAVEPPQSTKQISATSDKWISEDKQLDRDDCIARTMNKRCPLLLARWLSQGHLHETNEVQKKFEAYSNSQAFVPRGRRFRHLKLSSNGSVHGEQTWKQVPTITGISLRILNVQRKDIERKLSPLKQRELSTTSLEEPTSSWAFCLPSSGKGVDSEIVGTMVDHSTDCFSVRIWSDCDPQEDGRDGYVDLVMRIADEGVLWICAEAVSKGFFEEILALLLPSPPSGPVGRENDGAGLLQLQLSAQARAAVDLARAKTGLRLLFGEVQRVQLTVALRNEGYDLRLRMCLLRWSKRVGCGLGEEVLVMRAATALLVLRNTGHASAYLAAPHTDAAGVEALSWLQHRLRDAVTVATAASLKRPSLAVAVPRARKKTTRRRCGKPVKVGAVTVQFKKCRFVKPSVGIEQCMVFGDALVLSTNQRRHA